MATRKLTQGFVNEAQAEEGAERTVYWDEQKPGFGLMVTGRGAKSFVVQYRSAAGSRRMALKAKGDRKAGLNLIDARKLADAILGDVAKGKDPLQERRKTAAEAENTFKSICEEYFRRDGKKLRTKDHVSAALERLVYPRFGARQIDTIGRKDIVRLLDKIEDERGAVMADRTLAYIRRIMAWHSARSDDFRSPIVRGMARTRPKELARDRILTDDELRAVWKAAQTSTGVFGYFVRFILLTAARRSEAADMIDAELSGDDWIIPGNRYKNKLDHVVPLSKAARDLLAQMPRFKGVKYIFTTGTAAISGFSGFKDEFDKTSGVTDYTIHDLRRTARSLMPRAGISEDHAERCMGHVIEGVRGTYNRYAYRDEKRHAFEALAAQIDRIVNPPPSNVADLAAHRAAGV
jgi:integrase